MIVSRNEVHGVLRKAGLGAKLPAGVADDLANAASWMEGRSLPALADALDYIDNYDATRPDLATVFDLIATGQDAVDVEVATMLLIGFAAEAAGAYDMAFAINWRDGRALVGADGIAIEKQIKTGPAQVTQAGAPGATPPVAEIHVTDGVWKRANEMAAAYYVPATEASRLGGAGAGVNDND